MQERRRRFGFVVMVTLVTVAGLYIDAVRNRTPLPVVNGQSASAGVSLPSPEPKVQAPGTQDIPSQTTMDATFAGNILETLPVKGRAPKTGYKRTQFSDGWATIGNCDVRNHILARDMSNVVYRSDTDCTVMSGTIVSEPYTGKRIDFVRGPSTSAAVQIDHVVALSDAWQTGAQQLSAAQRYQLANDPLELLAVDGPTNNNKGDGDAASWLPPNKPYRCTYIARQIAVKKKYTLWVTAAERDAMRRVLTSCPTQAVPVETPAAP